MDYEVRCYVLPATEDAQKLKGLLSAGHDRRVIQVSDPKTTTNEAFVEMLASQTLEAQSSGKMLAKRADMDLLLRLSGTTQISRAIRDTGAKRGKPNLLIVVGPIRSFGRVSELAIDSLRRLPRRELDSEELCRIERAALLDAKKA